MTTPTASKELTAERINELKGWVEYFIHLKIRPCYTAEERRAACIDLLSLLDAAPANRNKDEWKPISEEAASLMDTTAGGRATADLVSVPAPQPGQSVGQERTTPLPLDPEESWAAKYYPENYSPRSSMGERGPYKAEVPGSSPGGATPSPGLSADERALDVLQDAAREGYSYVYENESDRKLWWADVLRAISHIRSRLSPPAPRKISRESLAEAVISYQITGPHNAFILVDDIQRFLHRLGMEVEDEQ